MTTQPLYQIGNEIGALLASETDGGELPTDLADRLNALAVAFDAKVDAICKFRVDLLGHASAIQEEAERLRRMHEAVIRRADWLKTYVHRSMEAAGILKIETTLFKVRIQRNGRPSITLADGAAIPEGFARVLAPVFDSQKAYDEWRAGNALPPCIRVVEGTHLRIA